VLTHLQLRDFVIVEEAALDFGPGLAALTGETGAGKSLVVDALIVLAGGRAGEGYVRQGAQRAEATAAFVDLPARARAWLESQAIEHDGEVLLRRVISVDGRSRAYVNGRMVPLQTLAELADLLIEIHGQQEFQHLVQRDAQREMLDRHGASEPLAAAVAEVYARYRDCRRELESVQAAAEDRSARLELLRYQVGELAAEVTTATQIEALLLERKRIAGRGRLAAAAQNALSAVYEADGDSAQDLLAKAQGALRAPAEADPLLAEASKLLADAAIQVQEAADRLRHYLEALDVDPARQEEIERRAAALEDLARKHRIAVTELPEQLRRLEAECAALERSEQSATALTTRLANLREEYRVAAERLTAARERAAADLGRQITALMQALGMAGGRFSVSVSGTGGEPAAHGGDQIEFLVAANPGQAPKSLGKVASGGELSRISLAVQVAAAAKTSAECMVFDEVDAGIGGAVAEIVGRQLRELGSRGQVLCVTHLAQVASQAMSQYRVSKRSDGKTTRTTIERLDEAERIDEIARMLGGVDITAQARAHAREMLCAAGAVGAASEAGAAGPKTRRSRTAR
jgi:DNA repair protein RecN (Recombination protein N)